MALESVFLVVMEDENDLYYGDLKEEDLKIPAAEEVTKFEEIVSSKESEDKTISTVFESVVQTILPIAMPFLHLYPIDNYTFGSKESLMEIETSYHNRMVHLEQSYKAEGMRRTVEAVLLTYENNHPHVLLLQLGDSTIFKL